MNIKLKLRTVSAAASMLAAISGSALAQAPSRDARNDLNYLERQRQQDHIQQEIAREREILEQHGATAPQADTKPATPAPEAKFLVTEIELLGDPHPDAEVKAILEARRGTTMGATEISAIIRDLTNHYIGKGFVTTIVTVHPGTLAGGKLTLEVKWGTIKGVTINGQPPQGIRDSLRLFSALPFAEGSVLDMENLDQAVDNLLRAGGNDRIRIVPSVAEGASVLDVIDSGGKPLTFGAGLNNSGRQEEGWHQYSATLGVNNLLGLNDTISTYYAEQDYKDGDNLQRIGSVNYSLPLGNWMLDASWYGSRYEKAVGGDFGKYRTDGSSQRYNARLSRLLQRNASGKTSGYIRAGVRDNDNAIEGMELGVSSKQYSEFGAGVTHVGALGGGWVYGDVSVSAGVPWFGAAWRDDPHLAAFDTDYFKVNGMVTWSRPFRIGPVELQYEAGGGFQYSPSTMVNDAQLSLGDEFTVRGFKDTAFYGDSGAYLSNTVKFPIRAGVLGGIEVAPFVGYDMGFVNSNLEGRAPEYLIGAAAGLRFASKYVTSSFSYGWPLKAPSQPQPLAKAINYRLDIRF